jgi:hypothetical protein
MVIVTQTLSGTVAHESDNEMTFPAANAGGA